MLIPTQWAVILDRLGGVTPTLLTMTLSASVAALVVMVLRLALKKTPSPYILWLWLVVIVRMLSPFGYGEGLVSLIPEPVTSGRAAEYILESGGAGTEDPAPTYQTADLPPNPDRAMAGPMPAAQTPDRSGEKHAPALITPGKLIPAVWLTGTAGMLLWSLAEYVRVRRRVAEAVRTEAGDIWEVYETDAIDVPFVLGANIYLPVGLVEADRKYVLLHEKAHVERYDAALKTVAWLALSLHWFNPVLWLAYRLMCRDVEAACDRRVIDGFDPETKGEDVAGYAAALLHLSRRERLPQAVLPFGEENAKGRIKNVLSYKKPAGWAAALALALCVGVGVGIALNAPAKEKSAPGGAASDRPAAVAVRPDKVSAGTGETPPPKGIPVSPDEVPDTGSPTAAGTGSLVVTADAGGGGQSAAARSPADPLRGYDQNGSAVGESFRENAEQKGFQTPVPEETGESRPAPEAAQTEPLSGAAGREEGAVVDLRPIYVPADRGPLPDSLDLDFTKQEGAE